MGCRSLTEFQSRSVVRLPNPHQNYPHTLKVSNLSWPTFRNDGEELSFLDGSLVGYLFEHRRSENPPFHGEIGFMNLWLETTIFALQNLELGFERCLNDLNDLPCQYEKTKSLSDIISCGFPRLQ